MLLSTLSRSSSSSACGAPATPSTLLREEPSPCPLPETWRLACNLNRPALAHFRRCGALLLIVASSLTSTGDVPLLGRPPTAPSHVASFSSIPPLPPRTGALALASPTNCVAVPTLSLTRLIWVFSLGRSPVPSLSLFPDVPISRHFPSLPRFTTKETPRTSTVRPSMLPTLPRSPIGGWNGAEVLAPKLEHAPTSHLALFGSHGSHVALVAEAFCCRRPAQHLTAHALKRVTAKAAAAAAIQKVPILPRCPPITPITTTLHIAHSC